MKKPKKETMNCPKCGVKNPGNENFCQSCGSRLSIPAAPAVQAVAAPIAQQGINKKVLLAIIAAGVVVFLLVLAVWPKGAQNAAINATQAMNPVHSEYLSWADQGLKLRCVIKGDHAGQHFDWILYTSGPKYELEFASNYRATKVFDGFRFYNNYAGQRAWADETGSGTYSPSPRAELSGWLDMTKAGNLTVTCEKLEYIPEYKFSPPAGSGLV